MMRVTNLNQKEARASGCWIRLSRTRNIFVKVGWVGIYGVTVDYSLGWNLRLNKNLNDLLGIWPAP